MNVPNQIHRFSPQNWSSFWNPHLSKWHHGITQEETPGHLRCPLLSPPSASIPWSSRRAFTFMMSLGLIPSFPPPGLSPDARLSSCECGPAWWPPLDPPTLLWPACIHCPRRLMVWLSRKKEGHRSGDQRAFRERATTEMSLERQQELLRQRSLGWGGRRSDEHDWQKEQESQGPGLGRGMASSRSYKAASVSGAREQNRASG